MTNSDASCCLSTDSVVHAVLVKERAMLKRTRIYQACRGKPGEDQSAMYVKGEVGWSSECVGLY